MGQTHSIRQPAVAIVLALAAAALLAVRKDVRQDSPRDPAAVPDIALQTLASGVGPITSIANAGDTRLFLTLQTGRIVIFSGGQVLPAPFLDLTALVSCCIERGLLSMAFHPQYASNGFFFVDYTNTAGNTVIARYKVSPGDPNSADPSSGVILLTILQPFANHNGGELQFGPDAYLYIGMGDGGSANDPMCNGQRNDTLLGKLLRIDVDQNVSSPPFYGIPATNPFASGGAMPEIWAKGLRNPWRFSFDRATGDLYIGDVGQDTREEIDFQPRASSGGENYGWKIMEGTLCGAGGASGCPAGVPACNSASFKYPIYEYSHAGSGGCTGSVIGGYVYRGAADPALDGIYLYGDYCLGWLFGNSRMLSPNVPELTTFGEDSAGELYLGAQTGDLYRIVAPAAPAPTPVSARMTPALLRSPRPSPRVVVFPTQLERVPLGAWGGAQISMTVTVSGATLQQTCASGTLGSPLLLDPAGRFDVAGTYTRQKGGPIGPGDTHPARYTGSTDGRIMTLMIQETDDGMSFGPFTLTFGVETTPNPCPLL
jgi:glucose/arabinose dehydrogenase